MSYDTGSPAAGGYGSDVRRWLADHPGHILLAGDHSIGYMTRREDGTEVSALTLDELDAALGKQ
jgi:hypothetical protein